MRISPKYSLVYNLRPGNLIRTKKEVSVYPLPKDDNERTSVSTTAKAASTKLEKGVYLLALTPVERKTIGENGPNPVFRFQLFALVKEQVVCFTCIGINDKLPNSAFEIVKTGDPNT